MLFQNFTVGCISLVPAPCSSCFPHFISLNIQDPIL